MSSTQNNNVDPIFFLFIFFIKHTGVRNTSLDGREIWTFEYNTEKRMLESFETRRYCGVMEWTNDEFFKRRENDFGSTMKLNGHCDKWRYISR